MTLDALPMARLSSSSTSTDSFFLIEAYENIID